MRILLVEDDEMLGQAINTALRRNSYTVDWLTLGEQVSPAVASEEFDLIILDLTLPDIDGLTVLTRLRKQKIKLPVLILTARDSTNDRVRGLDCGADDYLGKPFDLEELLARIRALLRRNNNPIVEKIIYHDLHLDPLSQDVFLCDKPIKLTPNEFKILHYLLSNQGRVLSKEKIQQALYGWDNACSDNAIEVHISNLRKKITGDVIQNIRGVGYIVKQQA